MSRLYATLMTRPRTIPALAVVAAAALLAASLLVQPRDRSDGRATGRAPSGAIGAVAEPHLVSPSAPQEVPADPSTGAGPAGAADIAFRTERSVQPASAEAGADAAALDPRIVRTAMLQLRVRRGAFEDAWSQVRSAAGAAGGTVVSASRSGSSSGRDSGTITIRVPSARFDATVDRMRAIDRTRVLRLDVATQDVTEEFVDVRSRLRHDRAVESRLLALLAQADGVSEVLAVQARLDRVQEQVEVGRGRLQYLEQMTSYSTVTVDLGEGRVAGDRRDGSVLGEAWDDARAAFADNVAGAIVWIGSALPALLVLAVVAAVARGVRRRRVT